MELVVIDGGDLNVDRAAGSQLVMDPNQMCKRARRSRGKMADICNNKPGLLKQIANGIALGQNECQYQFRCPHAFIYARVVKANANEPEREECIGTLPMLNKEASRPILYRDLSMSSGVWAIFLSSLPDYTLLLDLASYQIFSHFRILASFGLHLMNSINSGRQLRGIVFDSIGTFFRLSKTKIKWQPEFSSENYTDWCFSARFVHSCSVGQQEE
ncbi:hypothetical protein NQ317_008839 [Molorchus minor]|uniref:Uncharacterized protein n=1 Tax=Molorchus minor TaxID=1323400 RepID=A0ABQ9JF35_9CUCU|nr:hypothetical protein NQ317_008839 [Molorchus minor]